MTVKEALENKDIIFKSLLKLDKDCRDHFNDNDISNEQYFLYGIKFDLATNMMAIFLNDQICGIGSPGIELNARNVLEAIAILNCYQKGDLDQHNFDIYRDSYLAIEHANEFNVFKYLEEHFPNTNIIAERNKKREEFYDKWSNYYKCERSKFEKNSRDSLFYLQKNIDEPIYPDTLVTNYINPKYGEYHQFLGLLLHPAAFEENILDIVSKQRFNIIMSIYLFTLDYLKNNGYLEDNDMPSFEDYKKQIDVKENLDLVKKEINVLSKLNYDTTHYLDGSINYFYWRTIGSLICLVRDTEICSSFGFYEQATIKFKIFIETLAFFTKITQHQCKNDYGAILDAFRLSTTYQIVQFIKKQKTFKIENVEFPDEPLINIYNNYFKEKCPNVNVNTFIDKIKHDSTFFIYLDPKRKKSYRRVVKEFINDLNSDALGANTYNLYQISLDIGHSCGYALNSTIRVWDRAPKEITFLMFAYLEILFSGAEEYFKDKKHLINFPNDCFNYLKIFTKSKKAMLDLEIKKEIEEQQKLKD